ncbi:MAG: hypothetical protein AAFP90_23855, partial [Planctomycetota bacterium]
LTVFLSVAECPLRCVMCDLWKNTLPQQTVNGDVVTQIRHARSEFSRRLQERDDDSPRPRWIKLYNSGNFFDSRSIPPVDYIPIADSLMGFQRVIVENHPKIGLSRIAEFQRFLPLPLEIAVGVETLQTGMLRRLHKQFSRDDLDAFAKRAADASIDLRGFLMLRPPWCGNDEAIRWARLSLRHLFRLGFRHVTIIPTRDGNGAMESLRRAGVFTPPDLRSLRDALRFGLMDRERFCDAANQCVVMADLWDIQRVPLCHDSQVDEGIVQRDRLIDEIREMNHSQVPASA